MRKQLRLFAASPRQVSRIRWTSSKSSWTTKRVLWARRNRIQARRPHEQKRLEPQAVAQKKKDAKSLQTMNDLDSLCRVPQAERGRRWLLHMLLVLRHYGATDERDKIFSMFGLLACNKFRPGLKADYKLPFLEVSISLVQDDLKSPLEKESTSSHDSTCSNALDIIRASQPAMNPVFATSDSPTQRHL